MTLKRGASGELVRTVQEILNAVGVRALGADAEAPAPLKVDGGYGALTEAAVVTFQEQAGLLADGIVGPITFAALRKAYREVLVEGRLPGGESFDEAPGRLAFVSVPADEYEQGYGRLWLRSDVAEAYERVLAAVHARGGILTSSGGKRWLSADVGPNRAATSFHYTGRALDLFLYSGMVNPNSDPYVVVREPDRYHRVYARCRPEAADVQHLEGVVTYRVRDGSLSADGAFFDLTDTFREHGFQRIRARPGFAQGGSALAAEWWHFQWEVGLTPGQSSFGAELLKVYERAELEASPPWRYRDRLFRVTWA